MSVFSIPLACCALLLANTGPVDAGPSLSGWRLTLPVTEDGGTSGDPAVLDPAALDPPYLGRTADDALDFWAPTIGATTSHSGSPRTELIDDSGFTTGTGGAHTLSATVSVSTVPKTSKTIVLGQIHGDRERKSDPYVLLYYSGGTVHVKVNQQLESGSNYRDYPLLDKVGIGTTFGFTVADQGDGTLRFSAAEDGAPRKQTAPVPDVWKGEPVRFQAGDYEQLKGEPAEGDGGKAVFSALSAS